MSIPPLAVITGASGGIGRELAKQLSQKGYRVGLIARRQAELEAAVKECGGEGTAAFAVADVTDKDQCTKALATLATAFKNQPIDVLVNNAGRGLTHKPSEATVEQAEDMMKVNVHSVIHMTNAVLPTMKARKDDPTAKTQIVNVSSILGRIAENAPQRAFYSGAKHFLNAYSESLRAELKSDFPNITISTVSPGPISTDFGTNAGGGPSKDIPGVQQTEDCVKAIVDLIVNRKEECYTDPSWYEKVMNVLSGYGKP